MIHTLAPTYVAPMPDFMGTGKPTQDYKQREGPGLFDRIKTYVGNGARTVVNNVKAGINTAVSNLNAKVDKAMDKYFPTTADARAEYVHNAVSSLENNAEQLFRHYMAEARKEEIASGQLWEYVNSKVQDQLARQLLQYEKGIRKEIVQNMSSSGAAASLETLADTYMADASVKTRVADAINSPAAAKVLGVVNEVTGQVMPLAIGYNAAQKYGGDPVAGALAVKVLSDHINYGFYWLNQYLDAKTENPATPLEKMKRQMAVKIGETLALIASGGFVPALFNAGSTVAEYSEFQGRQNNDFERVTQARAMNMLFSAGRTASIASSFVSPFVAQSGIASVDALTATAEAVAKGYVIPVVGVRAAGVAAETIQKNPEKVKTAGRYVLPVAGGLAVLITAVTAGRALAQGMDVPEHFAEYMVAVNEGNGDFKLTEDILNAAYRFFVPTGRNVNACAVPVVDGGEGNTDTAIGPVSCVQGNGNRPFRLLFNEDVANYANKHGLVEYGIVWGHMDADGTTFIPDGNVDLGSGNGLESVLDANVVLALQNGLVDSTALRVKMLAVGYGAGSEQLSRAHQYNVFVPRAHVLGTVFEGRPNDTEELVLMRNVDMQDARTMAQIAATNNAQYPLLADLFQRVVWSQSVLPANASYYGFTLGGVTEKVTFKGTDGEMVTINFPADRRGIISHTAEGLDRTEGITSTFSCTPIQYPLATQNDLLGHPVEEGAAPFLPFIRIPFPDYTGLRLGIIRQRSHGSVQFLPDDLDVIMAPAAKNVVTPQNLFWCFLQPEPSPTKDTPTRTPEPTETPEPTPTQIEH